MSMMENEDLVTGPEERRRAADVLRRFSDKYLSKINMSNIRGTLDEEDGADDLWLESCSFDIMLQLLYISYGKMLQRVGDNKADDVSIFASVGDEKTVDDGGTVLAPETMAIVSDRDEDKREKKKRKYVPETSFLFDDDDDIDNDEEVFGNSEKKKKRAEAETAEVKRGEWLKAGKSKKSGKDPEPADDSPSLLKGRRKKQKDGVVTTRGAVAFWSHSVAAELAFPQSQNSPWLAHAVAVVVVW